MLLSSLCLKNVASKLLEYLYFCLMWHLILPSRLLSRCWRVTFHRGKHELQHVLRNIAAEHDPLPPETGSQGSVPAWQWPQTHFQDDHCFTKEAEGKGDGLAKHVSRLEPNRTSLGDPQAEGGGVQRLKYPPTPRRRHGGVDEHCSGYLWSSGKLHVQESKGSSG